MITVASEDALSPYLLAMRDYMPPRLVRIIYVLSLLDITLYE